MKITPGRERVASSPSGGSDGRVLSRTMMQKALARQAVMEREMARYMVLECGHVTTLEVQERYGHWRPRKGLAMCEQDDKWVPVKRPREAPPVPREPLF